MTSVAEIPPPSPPKIATASPDGDDLGRAIDTALDGLVRLLSAIRRDAGEADMNTVERARLLTRLDDVAGELEALVDWITNEGE